MTDKARETRTRVLMVATAEQLGASDEVLAKLASGDLAGWEPVALLAERFAREVWEEGRDRLQFRVELGNGEMERAFLWAEERIQPVGQR